MAHNKQKPGWNVYRFDQIAQNMSKRVHPKDVDVEYYIGLEHLDPETLKISRWGSPSDVDSTKLQFDVGDIIFGKRRVYQRKLGVAEFKGICSAHALVLRAKPKVVLPDFLPFFMQSDFFMELALSISVGSLSPTINWSTLAKQEFALPPLDEQRRIVEVLQAVEESINSTRSVIYQMSRLKDSLLSKEFKKRLILETKPQIVKHYTSLEKLVRFSRGLTYSGKDVVPQPTITSTPCVGIPCITGSWNADLTKIVHVENVSEVNKNKRKVNEGAVLLIGSNGNPKRIGQCSYFSKENPYLFGGFLFMAESKDKNILASEYLYLLFSSPLLQESISIDSSGSTGLQNLSLDWIKSFQILLPDLEHQKDIISRFSKFLSQERNLEERLLFITNIKKTYLSEMIQ